jgi:hypothetical protein
LPGHWEGFGVKWISPRRAVAVAAAVILLVAAVTWAAGRRDRALTATAGTNALAGAAETSAVGAVPRPWTPSLADVSDPTPLELAAPPATLAAARLPEPRFTLDAYRGFGAWVDVYDWSATFATPPRPPPIQLADIDRMAGLGVQTLFIQTSKWDSPTDVLEPERLMPLINRARSAGMLVVAWYLPTFEDPAADLRRLLAAADLPVDGLAVDIESTKVVDVAERSRRLVDLSEALAEELPGEVLGAIPFPPVATDVINPNLWPGFPWAELGALYDVWLPMSYWTVRTPASGYHDGYLYTAENIDRLRTNLGNPNAAVHTIGGIGDVCTLEDIDGMVRAATERGVLGGSIYDYRTTYDALWPALQGFRA